MGNSRNYREFPEASECTASSLTLGLDTHCVLGAGPGAGLWEAEQCSAQARGNRVCAERGQEKLSGGWRQAFSRGFPSSGYTGVPGGEDVALLWLPLLVTGGPHALKVSPPKLCSP